MERQNYLPGSSTDDQDIFVRSEELDVVVEVRIATLRVDALFWLAVRRGLVTVRHIFKAFEGQCMNPVYSPHKDVVGGIVVDHRSQQHPPVRPFIFSKCFVESVRHLVSFCGRGHAQKQLQE